MDGSARRPYPKKHSFTNLPSWLNPETTRSPRVELNDDDQRHSFTNRALPVELTEPKGFAFAKIAPYLTAKPVGEGQQAWVYAIQMDGKFALKTLKKTEDDELRSFRREVRLLAQLQHENICSLVAVGTMNGLPCAMLEWVDFNSSQALKLKEVPACRRSVESQYPPRQRYQLIMELAGALDFLHTSAVKDCIVLHRDLKPDNYGITSTGRLKLLDFGLAVCLLTENTSDTYVLTGDTGSTRYMAPEVARCEAYGPAADVYSFAVSAWEILCLRGKPYAEMTASIHRKFVVDGKVRPKLPSGWHPQLSCLFGKAWHPSQITRPDFHAIRATLTSIFSDFDNDLNPIRLSLSSSGIACCP